jgi:hypothetical protein
MNYLPPVNFEKLYARFDAPLTAIDCGEKCAPHHPGGIPFCCDICSAVPAVYRQEWDYLQPHTDLWHVWRGDECPQDMTSPEALLDETPEHMLLMACQGVQHCQREYRSISCREFPFFPYVTGDYRFLGLAYEWEFEPTCWVISHLEAVSRDYWQQFIAVYDHLFALWQEDFDSYAIRSEQMREYFSGQKRRIPILHRNGGYYLLSPRSERLQRITPDHFKRFGPYR